MAIVEIIPATEEHVEAIARNVRPADRAELWACAMRTPEQAMLSGLKNSDIAMVGLVDGEPVCMWGVVEDSLIGPVGTPWMIATVALEKYARIFIRRCRAAATEVFRSYQHLENYVHAENTKAIEWLKWLGFSVCQTPEEYGMLRQPFHKFVMRRF